MATGKSMRPARGSGGANAWKPAIGLGFLDYFLHRSIV